MAEGQNPHAQTMTLDDDDERTSYIGELTTHKANHSFRDQERICGQSRHDSYNAR